MKKITIEVEVEECMPKNPETGMRAGHMHMMAQSGKITMDGKEVGEFGFSLGCDVVFSVGEDKYHVRGKQMYAALYDQLNPRPLVDSNSTGKPGRSCTGRPSSSPNLQNLPIKSDLGRQIRDAFEGRIDHNQNECYDGANPPLPDDDYTRG